MIEFFCLLSRVGPITERRLWQRGGRNMDGVPLLGTIPGIGPSRKTVYDAELSQAQAHRAQKDARYFGNKLPASEHWRLYECLPPRALSEQFTGPTIRLAPLPARMRLTPAGAGLRGERKEEGGES